MQCSRCHKEAVVTQDYSGLTLCEEHLIRDIGAKVKRTIRSHRWLEPRDHIAVALSGRTASAAVLAFLHSLVAQRRDIKITALNVSGISESGEMETIVRRIAEQVGVSLTVIPCAGTDGDAESRLHSTLTAYGSEQGITKIALGTVLEDRSEEVLAQIFEGSVVSLLGQDAEPAPAFIHPFLFIPGNEVMLAAQVWFPGQEFPITERIRDGFHTDVKSFLNEYTGRHPSTRYSLVNLAERLSTVGCGDDGDPKGHNAGKGRHSQGRAERW